MIWASAILLPALTSSCGSDETGSSSVPLSEGDSLSIAYGGAQAMEQWWNIISKTSKPSLDNPQARADMAQAIKDVLLMEGLDSATIKGLSAGASIADNLDFLNTAGIAVNRKTFLDSYNRVFSSEALDSIERVGYQATYDDMMSGFNNLILKQLRQLKTEEKRIQLKKNEQNAKDVMQKLKSQDASILWDEHGIGIKTYVAGSGKHPQPGQSVEIIYDLKGVDGTLKKSTEGASMVINPTYVVDGLSLAFLKMQPGGEYEVYVPSSKAYGRMGYGDEVEPGEMLVFHVKFIKAL